MKRVNPGKNTNSDLAFVVKVDDRIVCNSYPLVSPSWLHFEQFLRNELNYAQFKVKYKDEDGDDVCLSSEEEFQEALKVYQKMKTFLTLTVTPVKSDVSNEFGAVDGDGLPKPKFQQSSEILSSSSNSSLSQQSNNAKSSTSEDMQNKSSVPSSSSLDNAPPEWFYSYMEKFKNEVATESARKVVHRMQKLSLCDAITNSRTNNISRSKQKFEIQETASETIIPLANRSSFPSESKQKSEIQETASVTIIPLTNRSSFPSEKKVIHTGITCDNCRETIIGVRYKCGNCVKFDLCSKCESLKDIHPFYHVFVKIRHPTMTAGINRKTGKMTPLLKYLLYDEFDKSIDIRTDREKKLLKRLEKQAHKLDKYREKYRQRHSDRNVHMNPWEISCGHARGNHSHYHQQHYRYQAVKYENENEKLQRAEKPEVNGIELDPFTIEMMDATFVNDETFPDGSEVLPNSSFTKCWRLLNSGTKPWTDETVLKCLWGTVGLKPKKLELSVPSLKPGEEGTVSVDFVAPAYEGHFESHWRLFHQGQKFGHRIWCSVVVTIKPETSDTVIDGIKDNILEKCVLTSGVQIQEPENGEKEPVNEKKKNNKQDLSSPVNQKEVSKLVHDKASINVEKEETLQVQYGSITATPNNTPRDLSPPKSPEPERREHQENLISELAMAFEEKDRNNFLSEGDSDFGGSLVSLSSNDSDLGYVFVPMPQCFNLSIPAVFPHDELKAGTPGGSPTDGKEENSSVTTATDTDDENASEYRKTQVHNSSNNVNNASDTEEDCSRNTLQDEVEPNEISTSSHYHNENILEVEAESGENLTSQSTEDEVIKLAENVVSTTVNPPQECTIQTDQVQAEDKTPLTVPVSSQISSDRMVPILPEPIMTVAASVFNSARDIITTITEASNMRSAPCSTAETTTSAHLSPQNSPTNERSPLEQLHDMGFCNKELNEKLLDKYNGDVSFAVAELLTLNDNDWYNNRH